MNNIGVTAKVWPKRFKWYYLDWIEYERKIQVVGNPKKVWERSLKQRTQNVGHLIFVFLNTLPVTWKDSLPFNHTE